MRIVCGSWKKMSSNIKNELRTAIETGGAHVRISDDPMVYLDKNYVAMFGGIQASLTAAAQFNDRKKMCIRDRRSLVERLNVALQAQANRNRIIITTGLMNSLDNFFDNTHTVFQCAAIFIRALIGHGHDKLIQQIAPVHSLSLIHI